MRTLSIITAAVATLAALFHLFVGNTEWFVILMAAAVANLYFATL